MKRWGMLGLASLGCFASVVGCVVCIDGEHGCSCDGSCGTTFRTASTTERLSLDAAGMESLIARSHNGSVEFVPTAAGQDAYVEVTKKTGGSTPGRADDAMTALLVYAESAGTTRHVGYRWTQWKRPDWTAHVSFRIHAPSNVNLDFETHNGGITVSGANGDVRLVTHNGAISTDSARGTLSAETHNGGIRATYGGGDVRLSTHNGPIVANLSGCAQLSGDVTTHNGRVEVIVGAQTSTQLRANTQNGGLAIQAPLADSEVTGRSVSGRLGSGEGRLEVTTHNGSVLVKDASS